MNSEITPELLPQEAHMSFWDHVGELRQRLVYSCSAIAISASIGYFFRFKLWDVAKYPLYKILERHPQLGNQPFSYTDLAEPFMALMRLSFWCAIFAISPFLFSQIWLFIKPALRSREKKMALTFISVTSICFLLGAAIAYFFLFGLFCEILLQEAIQANLRPNLKPTEYLNLFLYTVAGTGLAFETPVLFYFLARFGLVRSADLLKYWRQATIIILFVSAFLTPGDVVATTILFGVILLALYFVSTLVVWVFEPKNIQ